MKQQNYHCIKENVGTFQQLNMYLSFKHPNLACAVNESSSCMVIIIVIHFTHLI